MFGLDQNSANFVHDSPNQSVTVTDGNSFNHIGRGTSTLAYLIGGNHTAILFSYYKTKSGRIVQPLYTL